MPAHGREATELAAPGRTRRVAWQADFYDARGERRRRQFSTKREAEEWESQERIRVAEEVRRAALPAEERRLLAAAERTVSDLADEWLEACKRGLNGRPPVEARTFKDYEGSVRLHIKPRIGTLRLSDLDGPAVAQFRERLLAEVSRRKAQRTLRHLRQMLNHGVVRGYIAANPASSVRIVAGGRDPRRLPMPSDEQVKALLLAIDRRVQQALREAVRCQTERPEDPAAGQRFRSVARSWRCFGLLIRTAALTGLRISELRALAWDAVDLGAGLLRVRQRADQLGAIGSPKSRAAYRTIMLPASLVADLAAWREECPKGPLNLVFPASNGGLQSDSNLRTRFLQPASADAGLVDARGRPLFAFHAYRHYRVSVLIAAGLSLKEIMAEIGHADSGLTLDTYGHLLEEETERRRRVSEAAAARLVSGPPRD